MLRGLKEKYELHHGLTIRDSAVVASAHYAHRYMTDRKLPDKAIDLLDEAGSRLRMQQESKPEAIADLERKILTRKIESEALKKETVCLRSLTSEVCEPSDVESKPVVVAGPCQ